MERDVLNLLSNNEKWFLGDGQKLCFAPEFPEYRDSFGFFDKGSYINFTIDHIFTIQLIEDGNPINAEMEKRIWYPHKIKARYSGEKLNIIENKTVVNGCFASELYIRNDDTRIRNIQVVAWCPNINSEQIKKEVYDFEFKDNALVYSMNTGTEYVMPGRDVNMAFGSSEIINSFSVSISQGRVVRNKWETTPFYEKLNSKGLCNDIKLNGVDLEGIVYSAIEFTINIFPGDTKEIKIIKAIGDSKTEALGTLKYNKSKFLHLESKNQWREYFNGLPQFFCSDEFINKYYWYRWYGIRLNTVVDKKGNYEYPFISEGIGFFRSLITYSATCMALETRWLNDKQLAEGIFYNVINNQLENGMFPGIIRENYVVTDLLYHTFWGKAALEVYYKFKDKNFLQKIYEPFIRYVGYFEDVRDCENSNLFDIINQIETGQEYSPRYLFADSNADLDVNIRVKGVDATTYIYDIYKALSLIARELGYKHDEDRWNKKSEEIKQAALEHLWDEDNNMFYDVCVDNFDGQMNLKKSLVKALTSFYPFMTDMVDIKYIKSIYEHLLNEKEFWSPFPVSTVSMDDPYYSSDAEWKGKRHVCPWNGRVWPITNCHVIEILAKQKGSSGSLENKLVELITKTIKMMYSYGDINKPNCYEHYNPMNGRESYYRGVNDYMHSWIVDIILKYVVGIRIDEKGIRVEPLDFYMDGFSLDNLYYCNHKISLFWYKMKKSFNVLLDGEIVYSSDKLDAFNLTKYL